MIVYILCNISLVNQETDFTIRYQRSIFIFPNLPSQISLSQYLSCPSQFLYCRPFPNPNQFHLFFFLSLENVGTTPPIHKAFVVTNIKTHIHIVLDLQRHNYHTWREFIFTTHCEAYDTLHHIDDTFDAPTPPSTDPQWKKVDAVIRTWLYITLSQNLTNSVVKTNCFIRQLCLTQQKTLPLAATKNVPIDDTWRH